MHVCVQGSRLDSSARTHTHARTHTTRVRTIMISSSLGRCTSAAQRGGNITFLFLWKCGNKDTVVFVYAVISFVATQDHIYSALPGCRTTRLI